MDKITSFELKFIKSESGSKSFSFDGKMNTQQLTQNQHIQLSQPQKDLYYTPKPIKERPVMGLKDNQLYMRLKVNDTMDFTKDNSVKKIYFNNNNIIQRENDKRMKIIKPGNGCLKIVFNDNTVRLVGIFAGKMKSSVQVGSVSEDDPLTSLQFWSFFGDEIETSKYCETRYIYLNGGPGEYGWRMNYTSKQWNSEPLGKRAISFIRNSQRLGMIPCFVYYNIPDNGESYLTNLEHIQSKEYMTEYYKDLFFVLDIIKKESPDIPVHMIFEPDFLGYLMQNSGRGSENPSYKYPKEIMAHVSPVFDLGILDRKEINLQDNVNGLVRSVNHMVSKYCPNVNFGWQINVWSSTYVGKTIHTSSLMKVTDKLGTTKGIEFIYKEAFEIANYYKEAGIVDNTHFFSVDKYGLSFRGVDEISMKDASKSAWGWNHDHWMNYLYYCKVLSNTLGLKCALWQIPSSHLNSSKSLNPYTKKEFKDIENVPGAYEDSAITFFFGDTFKPSSLEKEYWSKNDHKTNLVEVVGDNVIWKSIMNKLPEYNIILFLSGAGVGNDTHSGGLSRPITDDQFFITKVQEYYSHEQ